MPGSPLAVGSQSKGPPGRAATGNRMRARSASSVWAGTPAACRAASSPGSPPARRAPSEPSSVRKNRSSHSSQPSRARTERSIKSGVRCRWRNCRVRPADCPCPGSERSKQATSTPRSRRLAAADRPITPPPITHTSLEEMLILVIRPQPSGAAIFSCPGILHGSPIGSIAIRSRDALRSLPDS